MSLIEKDLPVVGGLRVDLDSLRSIAHRCDPSLCRGLRGCCSRYEVTLGPTELSTIIGMLPEAARYVPALADADLYEELDEGEFAIETDEEGRCVFAYRNHTGDTLCALHSAALRHGLDPVSVKPRSCFLWPLALTESKPPVLSIQDDAFTFPCNRRRLAKRGLDPGILAILEGLFGESFVAQLTALE